MHRARGDCSHVGEGGAFAVDHVYMHSMRASSTGVGVWHWLRSLTSLLLKLETPHSLNNGARFTAASIAIITTDTGETQAPKVGHEMSDVINTPSYYAYHGEWW